MANNVLWLMFNFQGNSVWHGKWSLVPKEKKKKKPTQLWVKIKLSLTLLMKTDSKPRLKKLW